MAEERTTHFIASALAREVKAFDGNVLTEEDTVIWFGMSEGYPTCQRNKRHAYRFDSAEEIKERAKSFNGMPWYFQLKPGTLRIFKVLEIKRETLRYEEEVPSWSNPTT